MCIRGFVSLLSISEPPYRDDAVDYSPEAGQYVSSQPDKGCLSGYPYPQQTDLLISKITVMSEITEKDDVQIEDAIQEEASRPTKNRSG